MKSLLGKIKLPSWKSALLAFISAILLILSFPDFEFWFLAYGALIPLFFAVEREKESFRQSFITGWIFGTVFFTGTCWWLTYAPINYGGVPTILAYILLLGATSVVGLFSALFAGLLSLILKRFGTWGFLSAPFLWTALEFLRFWTTGNNWNAIAYSQAFDGRVEYAEIGGIYLLSFFLLFMNTFWFLYGAKMKFMDWKKGVQDKALIIICLLTFAFFSAFSFHIKPKNNLPSKIAETEIVAIQPNVPMSSIRYQEWLSLRERHIQLAERELEKIRNNTQSKIVIFPESPMNFGWTQDREFQEFLQDFTRKENVQILFNAAEPSEKRTYYNSAVLVSEKGRKIAQYDKIHLVPFGEYVPLPEPLASIIPSMVGNFEIGSEFDIVPLGNVNSGIMICFESHFPTLSRQFVLNGADVLVEMTNDGYLGPTPILRQHLANAVFRAVETNRPVLRVTNVGITAYINERGEILNPSQPYSEDSRVWSIAKSDGSQTFYVRYGDWFAWLCVIVSVGVLLSIIFRKNNYSAKGLSK